MTRAALFCLLLAAAPPPDAGAWLAELGAGGPLAGLALLRACALIAAATLVSEDLTCLAAGALVARGALGFAPAAAACFAGIFVGDLLLFLCGRWCGPRVLARAPCSWFLDERRVGEAARWLERRGPVVILASRFLPGARLPTYFASGALGTSVGRFALWFALAGLLWTPAVVALAAGLGGGLARLEALEGRGAWLLAGTLVAGWGALALGKSLATFRGRALLRARLRRVARFEYWPIGVFYLPVFALAAWKALRGRGLDFTAANPALPHGGVVGESKAAIHALLERAGAPLPRTLCLARGASHAARLEAVAAFRREHSLALPLVVKPDAGQRGDGVRVTRDETALESALAADEALLVQEHVSGEEYGLFYARAPGAAAGGVPSVTHKVLPEVVGDGRSTLERLVLSSHEHLPMARLFLAPEAPRRATRASSSACPPRGSASGSASSARTAAARASSTRASSRRRSSRPSSERVARAIPGFRIGRFDVRAPSAAALARGRFTVLELNGVTAEAAHVYDPRHGLVAAWRSLVWQWRLAYAIGAENARAGARVSSLAELVAALRDYRALDARRVAPRSGATAAALAEARP